MYLLALLSHREDLVYSAVDLLWFSTIAPCTTGGENQSIIVLAICLMFGWWWVVVKMYLRGKWVSLYYTHVVKEDKRMTISKEINHSGAYLDGK